MTLSTGISRSSRTNAALFAKDQRSAPTFLDIPETPWANGASCRARRPLAKEGQSCA